MRGSDLPNLLVLLSLMPACATTEAARPAPTPVQQAERPASPPVAPPVRRSASDPLPLRWPLVRVNAEDAPLGKVLLDITRQVGKRAYFTDRDLMNERVTVSLGGIPWKDAVSVVVRMANKTPILYPDGVLVDWACCDFDPESPPAWGWVEDTCSSP